MKPGAVAGPDGKPQAPHIVVAIFARGLLVQLYTRIYFADEAANASDPILTLVPADRRDTLIAKKETHGGKTHLPLRHPPAGRRRDGVLRRVTAWNWNDPDAPDRNARNEAAPSRAT